jgi:pimeloyl-ACP methyl ester carboxylesterase
MRGIAQHLAQHYQTITLDWIGFGESDRPILDYKAEVYRQLLQDFIQEVIAQPLMIVGVGHSAGYAMHFAQTMPEICTKIVLVAPTWRGPFTVMGAPEAISTGVREAVRSPLLGQILYSLNTTRSFLRLMYKQHVYTQDAVLTPEFMAQKQQTTRQMGARYAPAAFVTGKLDPVKTQAEFLSYFQPLPASTLVIIGEQSPAASRQEMEAITSSSAVKVAHLPGALGVHEEYADAVAELILQFLNDSDSGAATD